MKYKETIQSYNIEEITDHTPRIKPSNPSKLSNPNFLMCAPFSYHTTEANNIWMQGVEDNERTVDITKAFEEFQALYQFMVSQGAFVHLLPVPEHCQLQDLVFCANSGIALSHLAERNTFIVSNFTSPPRQGETEVIKNAMEAMGYRSIVSPYKFEGEADLKFLHGNVYIGGYGIRSEKETYDWMEENFDMKVIKVGMNNDYLYHLDCSIFPITTEDTLVCTEVFDAAEIKEIERYTNIIDVDKNCAVYGMTNSVRIGRYVLNMGTSVYGEDPYSKIYQVDTYKRNQLEKICGRLGLEVKYFSLNEYVKGGAALSCLILHLNK